MKMKYSLVILDRDGVINYDSADYIKSPEEWHAIEGSLEAIAQLNRANIKVAVATNQSGIARGFFDEMMLEKIHQKMLNELASVGGYIDTIVICPHHPTDNCLCRKPRPGLLQKASNLLDIPLTQAIMIGDSFKDFQATQQAGCDFALVKTGNGMTTLEKISTTDVLVYADLLIAVKDLLS